ncbi:MAG: hypothetical protein JNM27_22905 [Leptospirales bacterium]|nr:hypothetical protein [Leptospirales bacterium]
MSQLTDTLTGMGLTANTITDAIIREAIYIPYLRLTDRRVGLLINFGAPTLREGLQRIVNRFRDDSA